MSASDNAGGPPPFDQILADSYVGKYILVGLTYLTHAGQLIRQQQMHGVISSATPKGIVVTLKGAKEGTSWTMPPALQAISPAKPGEYKLRATGETVVDPDLLATWQITEPQKH